MKFHETSYQDVVSSSKVCRLESNKTEMQETKLRSRTSRCRGREEAQLGKRGETIYRGLPV